MSRSKSVYINIVPLHLEVSFKTTAYIVFAGALEVLIVKWFKARRRQSWKCFYEETPNGISAAATILPSSFSMLYVEIAFLWNKKYTITSL